MMTILEIIRSRAQRVHARMQVQIARMNLTPPMVHGQRGMRIATRPLRVVAWHRPAVAARLRPPHPEWVPCPRCGAPPRVRGWPATSSWCKGPNGGPRVAWPQYHAERLAHWRSR